MFCLCGWQVTFLFVSLMLWLMLWHFSVCMVDAVRFLCVFGAWSLSLCWKWKWPVGLVDTASVKAFCRCMRPLCAESENCVGLLDAMGFVCVCLLLRPVAVCWEWKLCRSAQCCAICVCVFASETCGCVLRVEVMFWSEWCCKICVCVIYAVRFVCVVDAVRCKICVCGWCCKVCVCVVDVVRFVCVWLML